MRRRDMMLAAAGLPFATLFEAMAGAAGPAPGRLRITDVRTAKLRLVKDYGTLDQVSSSPPLVYRTTTGGNSITEITTDGGVTGIGPGVDEVTVAQARQLLVGRDPFDMNDHAFRLYNPGRRGGGSVELALWDLIGKATGQPLYKLWGGAVAGVQTIAGRRTVTPYASQWTVGTPADRAAEAQRIRAEGWRAMKLKLGLATLKQDVALIEAARRAVGDDLLLMCDGNKAGPYGANGWPAYSWDYPRALATARALQPYDLLFMEEPLPRFDYDQLAQLNKAGFVPIAGGENDVGIQSFLTVMQKGCFAYVQPEVLAIGPTMMRTIAAMAAAYDLHFVPHGGSGGVCWVALMHLVCALPNAPMMELIHEPPHAPYTAFMDIFEDPPLMRGGTITVPDGPGLGVTIKPDLLVRS